MLPIIEQAIGGQRHISSSQRRIPVFNPSTGEEQAELPLADNAEVNQAVAAAHKAFPAWAATPPLKRAQILFGFKNRLDDKKTELAHIVSREHGKVVSDALGEIARALEVVEFACGIPHLLRGDFTRNVGTNVDSYSDRQPLGVSVGITPFNFPAMVPIWMFAISIACGNTFVLKPSERDPSAALFLHDLLSDAGLPSGVFNVLHGDQQAVQALCAHPDVASISFVGSTPVAQQIYKMSAESGKRVQALGGAKNHMVIMPDADLEQAANALVGAVYGSAGERCMAISVALPVGEPTAEALREILTPKIRALKVGPSFDSQSDFGPLITKQHQERVLAYIEQGITEGAELVIDGRNVSLQGYENGFYVGPTFFDHVTTGMTIYQEEVFGPLLSVVRAPDYESAVSHVQEHRYGNGAAIFTRNGAIARNFANEVNIGMVGVNVPIPVPVAYHSFGGWKQSLFGDHGVYGMDGVRFYTRLKTITQRWPEEAQAHSRPQLDFPSLA